MAAQDAQTSDLYDAVLFDEVMREFYACPYYNVGWWNTRETAPREACDELLRRVVAPLRDVPARVLDAGCGLGGSTAYLHARWPRALVTGIGISRRQLDCARLNVPGAQFLCMDAAKLTFPPGSFDIVVAIESALHFDSREDFFGCARRTLRDGGQLVLCDLLVPSSGWPGAWSVPASNIGCTPQIYATHLAKAGFLDINVSEATEQCWDLYVERLKAFAAALGPSYPGRHAWISVAHALATADRPHYVLASATA